MKSQFDRKAVSRSFAVGDRVLVLLPVGGEKLSTRFCGPYAVLRKVGENNYVLSTPERRQKTRLCHINLLKAYVDRVSTTAVCCVAVVLPQSEDEGENLYTPPEPVSARVENTCALEQLGKQLSHLTAVQRQDVLELVASHPVLFKDRPGLTPLAIHDVETASAEAIKQHPYRFPPHKKKQVAEEVAYMLEIGAIEPGSSAWSSPVVLTAAVFSPLPAS
ncbi:hypothetical protein SKAU_G00001820 [Synaphobranchus kaupii]|uniref:Tf2-1-like SH3-like domain-containing protein n=1 Tax=Synaphobranchus kaupii TaxID=118154 RepID=A0A9Q1G9G9_SYNKA|nr:hypothetical protein SKAU_G00001820 [Synaphobranchus kaupii]